MKLFISLLLLVLSFSIYAGEPSADAGAHCKEQWTKAGQLDQRMFQHCVNKELEGFKEAESMRQQHGATPWFQTYVTKQCLDKWTKAGVTQNSMVNYCFKQELEGYNELKFQSTQSGFDAALAEACLANWSEKSSVFQMTAYCYKNKTETPTPGLPKKLMAILNVNPRAPASATATVPATVPATVQDLVGFDLNLDPNAFRVKYADKIKACKTDKYENTKVSTTFSVPVYVCEFKDNNGSIKFYLHNGRYHVYSFTHKFPQSGIKMRVAAAKLEEKVGAKADLQTYTSTISIHCGAQVKFFNGEAVIISENIMFQIYEKYGKVGGGVACADDIYLNSDAESVQYDNRTAIDAMDDSLVKQRIKAEDEKGKDLKL